MRTRPASASLSGAAAGRALRALGALLLTGAALPAADLPPVPDPYGLGERLALIDLLRTTYHCDPPPGADLSALRRCYRQAYEALHPPTSDAVLAADRSQRIRRLLIDEYGLHPAADLGEDALDALLAAARAQRSSAAAQAVQAAQAQAQQQARLADPSRTLGEGVRADRDTRPPGDRLARLDAAQRDLRDRLSAAQARLAATRSAADLAWQRSIAAQAVHAEAAQRYEHAVVRYNDGAMRGALTSGLTTDLVLARSALAAAEQALDRAQQGAIAAADQVDAVQGDCAALAARLDAIEDERQALAMHQAGTSPALPALPGGSGPIAGSGPSTPLSSPGPGAAGAGVGQTLMEGGASSDPASPPARLAASGNAPAALVARLAPSVVLLTVAQRGMGSGVVLSEAGAIVTNAHVVGDGQAPITAAWDTTDDPTAPANLPVRVVGLDPEDDLAVLMPCRAGGTYRPLPMELHATVGEPVYAAGFPLAPAVARALGTSETDLVVTTGTLSALRHAQGQVVWLQHDCELASGDSGGPLLDAAQLHVIGIDARVIVPETVGGRGAALSLAIPISVVWARFRDQLAAPRAADAAIGPPPSAP